MRILLIGGGGREHALAWKLAQSDKVEKIFAAPGNPGIAMLKKCSCIDLKLDDLEKVADYAEEESIDLTDVGPEATLVAGIADVFKRRGTKSAISFSLSAIIFTATDCTRPALNPLRILRHNSGLS